MNPRIASSGAMRALLIAFIAPLTLLACSHNQNHLDATPVRGPEVVLSARPDGGAPDGSAPVVAAENPPEPRWGDDCPAATAAPQAPWRTIRFELAPPTENDSPSEIPWKVQVAGEDQEVFPAVNREGTIMVERFTDVESFSGDSHDSVGFFSVVSGKLIELTMLSSNLRGSSPSPAAIAKERNRLNRDLAAAHRILDKSTWQRISSDRKPDGPCPGTPFTKLDVDRSRRDGFQWVHVTRFDRDGLDFEYQPFRDEDGVRVEEKVIIRALQADGTIREVALPHHLVPPGKTTWMSERRGTCGWSEGIFGFGSRELGVFFVYGDENFAGDSCGAELSARRASVIRLPPEIRTPR